MNDESESPLPAAAGWRLKGGAAIFVLSILAPAAGVPLVAGLGLSAPMTATISGVLLVAAEVLGILAVAVMGKPGFAYIKRRVFGLVGGKRPM